MHVYIIHVGVGTRSKAESLGGGGDSDRTGNTPPGIESAAKLMGSSTRMCECSCRLVVTVPPRRSKTKKKDRFSSDAMDPHVHLLRRAQNFPTRCLCVSPLISCTMKSD